MVIMIMKTAIDMQIKCEPSSDPFGGLSISFFGAHLCNQLSFHWVNEWQLTNLYLFQGVMGISW